MYTTLDFLVRLNARRFIVAASPKLKFRSTDETDTAHVVASYRHSQAVIYPFSRLHSNRCIPCVQCKRDTAHFESYAADVFITSCLPPCFVEGCEQGKNSVALINVAIKFGDEYLCLEFIFPKFFSKFFFQNFFSRIFFSKFFFQNFFPNIFSENFLKTFSTFVQNVFLKICFPTFFQNFFFESFTVDASPFTKTKWTLCICVMKNMISKRSKLDFSLVWLFFGSYCSHHNRCEKFNSFPATHNILIYSFQNLLYLIAKCIKFWLEVDTPIFLYNHSEASVKFVDYAN